MNAQRLGPPQFHGWRVLDCRTGEVIPRVRWVEIGGGDKPGDAYAQTDDPPKASPQTGELQVRIVHVPRIWRIDECKTFAIAPTTGQLRALRHQSARTDALHTVVDESIPAPILPTVRLCSECGVEPAVPVWSAMCAGCYRIALVHLDGDEATA